MDAFARQSGLLSIVMHAQGTLPFPAGVYLAQIMYTDLEKRRKMAGNERETCPGASTCSQSSCEGCPGAEGNTNSFLEALNPYSCVQKVIGVVSGKGGVGKSFVTASLASAMRKAGYNVGIMDADITGPSIPKMYGLHGPAMGSELGIDPIEAADGTKIMSINLLIDEEEAPVVWRGPVIAGTVKQFWSDVVWGDLDFMFVDMPPGTGDVPLTVFQSIPVDGVIIVTSPQDLVSLIVKKAYNMAGMMDIPVLGIVENYSYIACPCCGEHINLFGESHIDQIAAEMGTAVLGKIPMDPKYAAMADAGEFYKIENPYLQTAERLLVTL